MIYVAFIDGYNLKAIFILGPIRRQNCVAGGKTALPAVKLHCPQL
jgi:hypothetical protein